MTLVPARRVMAAVLLTGSLTISACSGGGGSGGAPTPIQTGPVRAMPTPAGPSPTPTATPPVNPLAFVCPTSNAPAAAVRGSNAERRLLPRRYAPASPAELALAVTYAGSNPAARAVSASPVEHRLGLTLVRSTDAADKGTTRLLHVPAGRAAAAAAQLRSEPGVRGVRVVGSRAYPTSVTKRYFTDDPYFTGFMVTVPPNSTATPPPPTFEVGPYEESSSVPGQWGDHAIGLEYAFGYSQPNNGSPIVNPNALGSAAVRIAIVDTGEDVTHPELANKIVHQQCYITDPSTGVQSTSNFVVDPDGHGTDVSGIAAAQTNNAYGFVGAGGNATIYAYRVYPTPDASCESTPSGASPPPQCGAETGDIASAINDAVAQHVDIISLSLGQQKTSCASGRDPDPVEEGAAISAAIAAGTIVVASSGNDGLGSVNPPACDTGVIAVGATGLADGQPTGKVNSGGSATTPIEYVSSYSNYGAPGASLRNQSAWGIVAPGGDPGKNDLTGPTTDELHWIENIYTSTTQAQTCSLPDYPGGGTIGDCRVHIAGTSMSAPLVAGAAALILSVNPTYHSAAAMKQLLCSTADDIGDAHEGCGRLNVYRAMATALHDPTLP